MSVEVRDSVITLGNAGVIFDNDGGLLRLNEIQVNGATASALVATANEGTSFLQDSTVTASNLNQITFSTASAQQVVLNVEVTNMGAMQNAFFVEGSGSTLSVAGTTVSRNVINPPLSWSIVLARSQATATITSSTFSQNRGVEFGVSAVLASRILLKDSNILGNRGSASLNITTAPVFAISDSQISVEETIFRENGDFSVRQHH